MAENWGAVREFNLRYPFAFLLKVTVASLLFTVVVVAITAGIDVTPARLTGLVATGVAVFLLVFRALGGLDREERRIIQLSSILLKQVILAVM